MTSHWCDFQNTDVILNCGSNSVENHPVSALWLEKAHEQGAKWIVVDPETKEVIKNPKRVTRPLVRRPGASDWEDITWEDAIAEIARKVKDTRDASFIEKNDNGLTVNYTPAIASLGGSQENSEEEYLILKMMRSLGVIAIDNQARV